MKRTTEAGNDAQEKHHQSRDEREQQAIQESDEDATDARQHGSTDALSKHGWLSEPSKPTHPHAEEHVPSEVFLRAPPLEDLRRQAVDQPAEQSDSNGAPRMAVTTAISMNQAC